MADPTKEEMDYASGAGTTKRKELHGTKSLKAFSGTWARNHAEVTLQAYILSFTSDQSGDSFSSFVLLTEAKLDDEVASMEVDLFLIPNRIIKTSVSPCGQVHLDAHQVRKSKLFHEFFFNGIFGKLFVGTMSSGMKRDFLLGGDNDSLWGTSKMYLLLPIETSVASSPKHLNIVWKGIDSCACVVEYLRKIYSSDDGIYCSNPLDGDVHSLETECARSDIIYLANTYVERQHLKDMVVYAIHTGKIYSVLDVEMGTSSEDPFYQNIDEKSPHVSFSGYFCKKYGIVLQHPGQPLLLLKQSHNAHNLLIPRLKYEDVTAEKKIIPAHMPPELLVHVDIPTEVMKSFYLLPSLMHRLESLLLASQLREEIACHPSDRHISSFLILEAITTLRCCESFSLERLELLGDSILKYVMSCHFFLKYPRKHEGQLSAYRKQAVCNMMLHKLGASRNLQGYIRDSAFDPRRWVAPGQTSLHPEPCDCGVDTLNVPLHSKYVTEKTSTKIGKVCDRGHRWMCSKTIADCVESLVGAYFVSGGLGVAAALMRWLDFDAEFEPKLIMEAKVNASLWYYLPKLKEIEALETKIGYNFSVKGLLLEAITHPSQQELGIGYCYQRLEFLGDSLLDLLITWHLFQSYQDIDPGKLTDLRSANVNNENFAEAAVRHNLNQCLQHGSGVLLGQITEYIKCIWESYDSMKLLPPVGKSKGPKVLADLVESIAGAVLIDTELDLDRVWEIFRPLLSPIVTPDKLELPPLRKLIELCDYLGYTTSTRCMNKNDQVIAEIAVQLKDSRLVRHGCDRNRKSAKAQAAHHLLKDLEEKGISHAQYVSRKKQNGKKVDESCHSAMSSVILEVPRESELTRPLLGRQNMVGLLSTSELSQDISLVVEHHLVDEYSKGSCAIKLKAPVVLLIKMQKGGPRSTLFELCKMHQWPMPEFDTTEEVSRNPIEFKGLFGTRTGFNAFISSITLHVPNDAVIKLVGGQEADKNCSKDSAAYGTLLELERLGWCIIKDPS
uniref:Endoribonuclease Dicer 3b n=1 Tax=Anthurium amnicola TaxID=1678845 RepID=A0A1D1YIC1_9ARAE